MHYREGSVSITSGWDINHDEIVLEVRIPQNAITKLSRREFADMMYDIMVAPLDEETDRDRNLAIQMREKRQLEAEIGVIPEGWYVWYCSECKYAVTFDRPTMLSYSEEGWVRVAAEAMDSRYHEH